MTLERAQAQRYANILDTVRYSHATSAPVDLTLCQSLDEKTLSNETRTQYLKYLRRLCGAHGTLPSSFVLPDSFDLHGTMPFARGGCASVYQVVLRGRRVAVKVLFLASGTEGLRKMRRVRVPAHWC